MSRNENSDRPLIFPDASSNGEVPHPALERLHTTTEVLTQLEILLCSRPSLILGSGKENGDHSRYKALLRYIQMEHQRETLRTRLPTWQRFGEETPDASGERSEYELTTHLKREWALLLITGFTSVIAVVAFWDLFAHTVDEPPGGGLLGLTIVVTGFMVPFLGGTLIAVLREYVLMPPATLPIPRDLSRRFLWNNGASASSYGESPPQTRHIALVLLLGLLLVATLAVPVLIISLGPDASLYLSALAFVTFGFAASLLLGVSASNYRLHRAMSAIRSECDTARCNLVKACEIDGKGKSMEDILEEIFPTSITVTNTPNTPPETISRVERIKKNFNELYSTLVK